MSSIWFGSLQNRLAERSAQPEPKVGMGVTRCMYSDRDPYEIIEVKDAKHIVIRAMGYERTDKNGMSECQEYRYFSKPDGEVVHLTMRNGRWRDRIVKPVYKEDPEGEFVNLESGKRFKKVGDRVSNELGCDGWSLGRAVRYYDFSF